MEHHSQMKLLLLLLPCCCCCCCYHFMALCLELPGWACTIKKFTHSHLSR